MSSGGTLSAVLLALAALASVAVACDGASDASESREAFVPPPAPDSRGTAIAAGDVRERWSALASCLGCSTRASEL